MRNSYWRQKASLIIGEVLRSTKGQPKEEVDKALRYAYPFGERAHHPYKIWLDEIKKQRGGHSPIAHVNEKLREWEEIYGRREA